MLNNAYKKTSKIAMLAPGYGNQAVGMGKEFYDKYRLFQENFEHASQCLGYNVTRLCFAASSADLLNPVHSYIVQFVHSHTIAQMLREEYNIKPDVVVGYGIGAIGALSAAKVLNFVDGIYIAKKFLEFCSASPDLITYSSYRIVGALIEDIKVILESGDFSSLKHVSTDSFKTHVVSGKIEELTLFVSALKNRRRSIRAQVMGLGHGLGLEILNPVVAQFKPYLNKVDFNPTDITLLSSISGNLINLKNRSVIETELLKSMSLPLEWPKVLRKLNNYDFVIVLGPSKLLKQGLEESINGSKLFFCDNPEELIKLQQKLQLQKFLNESDKFAHEARAAIASR